MNNVILFVSHKRKQCGVYEYGENIFKAISKSRLYDFIKAECDSLEELCAAIKLHKPQVILYNYHPSVLPWISSKISKGIYRNNISGFPITQVGIIHEVTQNIADNATSYRNRYIFGPSHKKLNSLFDFYIAPDPTLLLKNNCVFKTGRLIPHYNNRIAAPAKITIGSFGFGTPNKGFDRVVSKVQEEFDDAVIRLNIPFADFGDQNGVEAKKIADTCRKLIQKPGIDLHISHDFLNTNELFSFLASNTINVFMYEDTNGRGISSSVDIAMAVGKPIAVSSSPMFRHIFTAQPAVCLHNNSLKEIIKNGFSPIEELSKDWSEENLVWDYERIFNRIIPNQVIPIKTYHGLVRTVKSFVNKFFTLPENNFTWLRRTDYVHTDEIKSKSITQYTPVEVVENYHFNRILDDTARALYGPTLSKLMELVPSTMANKIPRANVQQSFVFDTVYRFITTNKDLKLLCVGSYEDTASLALQKLGFVVEEIDPVINYTLQEFYTKPSTKKDYYDIIFATSVIEHVPDDKSFIECLEGLLNDNGVAILTCDFKEGWETTDPKPSENARFYTKNDLERRLQSYLKNSEPLDTGTWNCKIPDFIYQDKYIYTFATFVFKKSR